MKLTPGQLERTTIYLKGDIMSEVHPYDKIRLNSAQYVYKYQMQFLANVANSQKVSSTEFKAYLLRYAMHNFLGEYIEKHPGAGYFYWDKKLDEFSFAISGDDDALSEALAEAGFIYMWEDEEDET